MNKSVRAVVEKGSNYLFHLLSVAKIGSNNEYADKYHHSVKPEDIEYLKNYEDLLSVSYDKDSLLGWIYIFFPSMLNLDTQTKINEYYSLLAEVIQSKSTQTFEKRYSTELKETVKMSGGLWEYVIKVKLESADFQFIQEAAEISKIIRRNFARYEAEVWPIQSKKLNETEITLNKKIKNLNLIGKLEEVMQSSYLENEFQIVLCSSNQNGVDAVDLSYNKNLHYFARPTQDLIHFVCHEIAIRFVIPFRNKMYNKVHEINDLHLYKTNEMMAEYYAIKVLDDDQGFKWFPEYLDFIQDSFMKNPKLNIEQLFDACYFGMEWK